MIENEIVGNEVETTTTDAETTAENENSSENDTRVEETEKTFTQEQVNNIIRERLTRDRESLYSRYNFKSKDELDNAITKSLAVDELTERLENMQNENRLLNERLLFLTNNISKNKEDDIKAYFKGKEMELNEENLVKELLTHKEWLNVADKPITTIKEIGVSHAEHKTFESEEEKQKRIFGI